jgi:carbohydrate-binding DOMON domain-containing protein
LPAVLALALALALVLVLAEAAAVTLLLPKACAGQTLVVWEADDPTGDDDGPGTYTYPTNPAFSPFSGIFDLTRFRVLHDSDNVYLEISLARIANTWNAPEGFSHQLINVYLDTTPNAGRVDTLRDGPFVLFNSRHAWDVNIKIMGWGGTRVYFASDDSTTSGVYDGVFAEALPDGKTIRATAPKKVVGEPSDVWKYYVLVASQDGYGPDNHRPVMAAAGPWVFGGGSDLGVNPNVIDILAPESGLRSQRSQLGSWNESERRLAVLYPANADGGLALGIRPVTVVAATLFVVAVLGYFAARFRRGRPGS